MVRSHDNRTSGTTDKKTPPVYSCKYWTGSGQLEVAVFANPSEDGKRTNYSTVLKKTYKAGENDFQESKSFYQEELPLIAAALLATFQAIQDIKDDPIE
jgi:hypothetical protein